VQLPAVAVQWGEGGGGRDNGEIGRVLERVVGSQRHKIQKFSACVCVSVCVSVCVCVCVFIYVVGSHRQERIYVVALYIKLS